MKPITVDKTWLIEKMADNRAKHRAVFDAALEGYRKEAMEELNAHIADLNAGRAPKITINLIRPSDHTQDYDRVIGMLKVHQGETYELTEQDYAQYVDDDWQWKRQWVAMSNSYAPKETQDVYTVVEG